MQDKNKGLIEQLDKLNSDYSTLRASIPVLAAQSLNTRKGLQECQEKMVTTKIAVTELREKNTRDLETLQKESNESISKLVHEMQLISDTVAEERKGFIESKKEWDATHLSLNTSIHEYKLKNTELRETNLKLLDIVKNQDTQRDELNQQRHKVFENGHNEILEKIVEIKNELSLKWNDSFSGFSETFSSRSANQLSSGLEVVRQIHQTNQDHQTTVYGDMQTRIETLGSQISGVSRTVSDSLNTSNEAFGILKESVSTEFCEFQSAITQHHESVNQQRVLEISEWKHQFESAILELTASRHSNTRILESIDFENSELKAQLSRLTNDLETAHKVLQETNERHRLEIQTHQTERLNESQIQNTQISELKISLNQVETNRTLLDHRLDSKTKEMSELAGMYDAKQKECLELTNSLGVKKMEVVELVRCLECKEKEWMKLVDSKSQENTKLVNTIEDKIAENKRLNELLQTPKIPVTFAQPAIPPFEFQKLQNSGASKPQRDKVEPGALEKLLNAAPQDLESDVETIDQALETGGCPITATTTSQSSRVRSYKASNTKIGKGNYGSRQTNNHQTNKQMPKKTGQKRELKVDEWDLEEDHEEMFQSYPSRATRPKN